MHNKQHQAMQEAQTSYRRLFDGVPVGLYRTTPAGQFIDANSALVEMLGYPNRASLLAINAASSYAKPDDRARWQSRMESEGIVRDFEAQVRRRDGTLLWVRDIARAIRDADGQVLYYEGSLEDISGRKDADAALWESEKRFRSVVQTASDAVIILDSHRNIILWNRAAETIFGYSSYETTSGKVLAAIMTEQFHKAYAEGMERVLSTGGSNLVGKTVEVTGARKDGREFPLEFSLAPWKTREGTFFTIIARDVTERKRVEEETKRRGEELEALQKISLAIAGQLELDELLQNVVEQGCRLLNVGAGGVYLVDETRGDLALIVGHGFAQDYTGVRLMPGAGVAGKVLQSGALLVVDDYHHWEGRSPDWEAESLTAVLGVPLKRSGQVIGILNFSATAQARSFDEHDVWLATLFANQAAIAIENARLYETVQRELAERKRAETERERLLAAEHEQRLQAETLREVASALNTSLDREQVLRLILEQLAQVVDYDSTSVMLVSDNMLEIVARRGFSSEEQKFTRLQIGVLLHVQEVIENRTPVIIPDTAADPRWLYRPASGYIRCWLGVPLVAQDRVIGLLSLDKKQTGFYNQRDAELAVAFANQAAVAIENARLYEQAQREITERKRAEEALEQRAAQLTLLSDVGGRIAAVMDLDNMLDRTARLVQESFGYHHVGLFTLDRERDELVMKTRAGDFTALFPLDHQLKVGQGMVGWAALHGETLLANDVNANPRYVNLYPGVITSQSELCVPIQVGEEVVGVLDVQSTQLGAFDENDVLVIETLANQIAVAIENARLYETVQQELTERKRAERQLQRYTAELEQTNEEVKQFAYIVSHDLRAPLVNLKGFATELRTALAVVGSAMITTLPHLDQRQQQSVTMALQEDIPEALGFIDSSVTRMDRFINAVLKLSRLGRRELKLETIDMNALVQATLQTLAHQIEAHKLSITVGALLEVVADRTSMEQILGNLLNNAVIYLDPNRPGEIEITAERAPLTSSGHGDNETMFYIRDNGRGIAERDMDKVFAPFRRAGRQDVPGEGMGLPYVQTLLRRHGGRIWVESELGKGSTFYFTIPTDVKRDA